MAGVHVSAAAMARGYGSVRSKGWKGLREDLLVIVTVIGAWAAVTDEANRIKLIMEPLSRHPNRASFNSTVAIF